MKEIISTRPLPHKDAIDALHAAIKTALGNQFAGIRAEGEVIFLLLEDTSNADDANTAIQITEKHDFSKRTEAQVAHAAKKAQMKTLSKEMEKLDIANPKPQDVGKVLQYLLLKIEDVEKRGKM